MSADGAKFVQSYRLTSGLGRCPALKSLDGFARNPAHLGGGEVTLAATVGPVPLLAAGPARFI
jgi:hypothetical protein